MKLRLLEHLYWETNYQLAISKDPDRTPKGLPILDKLSQVLEGILKGKALRFLVGMPSTIVLSSTDNLHTVCIQDNKAACCTPFLRTTIKLHMHSLA